MWFSRGIPKHRFLTWLMVLNRSPTRDRLIHWGLQTDGSCLLCNSTLETRSHLYFECNYSSDVWSSVSDRCSFTSSRSWDSMLDDLHRFTGTRAARIVLLLTWQATIYEIWRESNNHLHRDLFCPSLSIASDVDRTIRVRITSFRQSDPSLSEMLQRWLS